MVKENYFSSLERIYPDLSPDGQLICGSETQELHLERYRFAAANMSNGHIADIACGSGYGSFFLATNYTEKISSITAIDNNEQAISYAAVHYKHPLIDFQLEDAANYQPYKPINSVISLETIEHLSNPADFVNHWASLLVSGGRFIASAPVTPSMDANPFHLNDFTPNSFRKLFLDAGLKEVNALVQAQPYSLFRLFSNKENKRSEEIRKGLLGYYIKKPSKLFLRIKSLIKDGLKNKYLVLAFEK